MSEDGEALVSEVALVERPVGKTDGKEDIQAEIGEGYLRPELMMGMLLHHLVRRHLTEGDNGISKKTDGSFEFAKAPMQKFLEYLDNDVVAQDYSQLADNEGISIGKDLLSKADRLSREVAESLNTKVEDFDHFTWFGEVPFMPGRDQVAVIQNSLLEYKAKGELYEIVTHELGYQSLNALVAEAITTPDWKLQIKGEIDGEVVGVEMDWGEVLERARESDSKLEEHAGKIGKYNKIAKELKYKSFDDMVADVSTTPDWKRSIKEHVGGEEVEKKIEATDVFDWRSDMTTEVEESDVIRVCKLLGAVSSYYYFDVSKTAPMDLETILPKYRKMVASVSARADAIGLAPREGDREAHALISDIGNMMKGEHFGMQPLMDMVGNEAGRRVLLLRRLFRAMAQGRVTMRFAELKSQLSARVIREGELRDIRFDDEIAGSHYRDVGHTLMAMYQTMARMEGMLANRGIREQVESMIEEARYELEVEQRLQKNGGDAREERAFSLFASEKKSAASQRLDSLVSVWSDVVQENERVGGEMSDTEVVGFLLSEATYMREELELFGATYALAEKYTRRHKIRAIEDIMERRKQVTALVEVMDPVVGVAESRVSLKGQQTQQARSVLRRSLRFARAVMDEPHSYQLVRVFWPIVNIHQRDDTLYHGLVDDLPIAEPEMINDRLDAKKLRRVVYGIGIRLAQKISQRE